MNNNEACSLVFGKVPSSDVMISYVIPTYNRPDTLPDTIMSILRQSTCFTYEIIISDNSTKVDNNESLDWVRNLNNPHIQYYINKSNLGMVGNWNNCFKLANGKYVSMIHDDDLLLDNYACTINACIKKIEKNTRFSFIKVNFIMFSIKNHSAIIPSKKVNDRVRELSYFDLLLDGKGHTGPPTCGIIFNREIVTKYGGFQEKYSPCSDQYLGVQLINNHERGYVTEDRIAAYRWGENVSLKMDPLLSINQNYNIRDEIYEINKLCMLYGKLFKNIQFSLDVDSSKKFCEEHGIIFDMDRVMQEHKYVKSGLIKMLYAKFNIILRILFCKKFW